MPYGYDPYTQGYGFNYGSDYGDALSGPPGNIYGYGSQGASQGGGFNWTRFLGGLGRAGGQQRGKRGMQVGGPSSMVGGDMGGGPSPLAIPPSSQGGDFISFLDFLARIGPLIYGQGR